MRPWDVKIREKNIERGGSIRGGVIIREELSVSRFVPKLSLKELFEEETMRFYFILLNTLCFQGITFKIWIICVFYSILKYFSLFSHYHLILLYPPGHNHTVAHAHESFYLFAQSLDPLAPNPRAVSLLSVYESVSILPVRSVCSLDSTYE